MKTNVRSVSIEAYRRHIESGKALAQWGRVYEYLLQHPNITRAQIEKSLSMRISSVTGRIAELKEAGMVLESSMRITCPITHEEAHTLRAVEPEDVAQPDMFGRAA